MTADAFQEATAAAIDDIHAALSSTDETPPPEPELDPAAADDLVGHGTIRVRPRTPPPESAAEAMIAGPNRPSQRTLPTARPNRPRQRWLPSPSPHRLLQRRLPATGPSACTAARHRADPSPRTPLVTGRFACTAPRRRPRSPQRTLSVTGPSTCKAESRLPSPGCCTRSPRRTSQRIRSPRRRARTSSRPSPRPRRPRFCTAATIASPP
jgi:hypothetical protein